MPTTITALNPISDRDFTDASQLSAGAAQMASGPTGSIGDWDLLFNAVTARLRDIAGAVAALPGLAGMPPQARSKVLECAEALDQLHATILQQAMQRAVPATWPSALHDRLTALPNRDHFCDVLGRALMNAQQARPNQHPNKHPSLALLYLDLDGFMPINDQHGNAVGDGMLRIVASRLARAVRAGDCVGRMGGAEFACLLGGIDDRQQLSHLACKLFDTVSAPLQIGTLQLTVRPSIGIAICPTDGGTAEALLKRADAAMVRAKNAQSGYAFFERRADLSA